MKTKIIPAILRYTENDICASLKKAREFSDSFHLDIIDESFSSEVTLPNPAVFRDFTATTFGEVHLMVKDPIRFVKPFADAGFARFLGHVEHMSDQENFLSAVASYEKEAFLALDLPTPISVLTENLTEKGLRGLTILSVKAGRSGQAFEQRVIEKIKTARHLFPNLTIEVDGGINETTIVECKAAGANIFAASSALFQAEDPAHVKELLEEKISS